MALGIVGLQLPYTPGFGTSGDDALKGSFPFEQSMECEASSARMTIERPADRPGSEFRLHERDQFLTNEFKEPFPAPPSLAAQINLAKCGHFGLSAHRITNTDDDEFGDHLKPTQAPSRLNNGAELGICVHGIENGIGLSERRVILRK
jgi:hypothetical protein